MQEKSIYLSENSNDILIPTFFLGLKKKSQLNYYHAICEICNYCKKDFLDLSAFDVTQYFHHLEMKQKNGQINQTTLRTTYSMIHSFSSYLEKNRDTFDFISDYVNPFYLTVAPAEKERILPTDIPTSAEIMHLLSYTLSDIKMYCIIALIIRCGLTSSEICALQTDCLSQKAGSYFLTIHNINKVRIIPCPADLAKIIKIQLGTMTVPSTHLFENSRHKPLTIRTLQRYYLKYSMSANVAFTLQDIRSGSITSMLVNGLAKADVAKMLGINLKWLNKYDSILEYADSKRQAYNYQSIVMEF